MIEKFRGTRSAREVDKITAISWNLKEEGDETAKEIENKECSRRWVNEQKGVPEG